MLPKKLKELISMKEYRNKPVTTDGLPPGIPYIIGNEAQKDSLYGMKSILWVFMTTYLLQPDGSCPDLSQLKQKLGIVCLSHQAYFFPILEVF